MADFLRGSQELDIEVKLLSGLIGQLLHEPVQQACRIARDCVQEKARSRQLWEKLAAATRQEALRLADEVSSSHCAQIAQFIDQSTRGALITTIHGGDYLLALLKLLHRIQSEKQILIVRKKAASPIETRVFAHLNRRESPVAVLRHGESHPLRLVRALKRGHIVIALMDLPASFGPTIAVPFLGEAMSLVKGPGELAVLGNADIVPFFCHRSRGSSHATFCPPLRPRATEPACRHLAQLASSHIMTFPGQWQHWFHVPEMLGAGQ